MDKRLIGLVNGTDGGTWAPASPIRIAGAGLKLNDPPHFTTTKTRKIRISALEYTALTGATDYERWGVNPTNGSLVANADSSALWLPLTKLHHGATLSQVTVFFTVPVNKLELPPSSVYPTVNIRRHDPSFAASASLLSSGAAFPAAPTLAAYVNQGKPHAWVITPDQNNVIDKTTYSYFLVFTDDNVPGPPRNSFNGIELTFTNITSLDKA